MRMRSLLLAMALAAIATPALAEFRLASTDVKAGSPMAAAQVFNGFGCTGQNISPALSWSGEPAGTQSFAVTIFDPDAPTGSGFWHWTVFNIPQTVHQLAAGSGDAGATTLPAGAGEGRNDAGVAHYFGACPPPGDPPHRYQITVFAVKIAKMPLDAESSGARVGFQLHYNMLAKAQVVGLLGVPK